MDLLPPDNVKMVGMDDDGGGGGLEAALRPVPRDKVIFCANFPPEEGPTRHEPGLSHGAVGVEASIQSSPIFA